MVENKFVQMRGFHNLYDENGECWGFQFCMRTKYYKGLWLSQFRTGNCIVDGVVYPKDSLIWNIQGVDYTAEEMYDRMDVYWQLNAPAVVKVPKKGGLAQGYHTVEIEFGYVNNYNNAGEKEYDGSGLGCFGPYFFKFGGNDHPTERKLLLVW